MIGFAMRHVRQRPPAIVIMFFLASFSLDMIDMILCKWKASSGSLSLGEAENIPFGPVFWF